MDAIASGARRTLLECREALARVAGVEAAGAQDARDLVDRALEIDAALDRIEAGTYGLCERCNGAIGRLRLRAVPEARLCLACR